MAFSDPVNTPSSGNTLVDGLLWGQHWSDGTPATTSLAVYIAGTSGNEQFDFGGTTVTANTVSAEVTAFRLAMSMFESICNIDFTEVGSQNQADIIVGAVNNRDASGALGIATPPGEDTGPLSSQQGSVIVNFKQYQSSDFSSLLQGGYDFISFIHEFGHAIGLKHPHDRGGGTFPKFPGVSGPFDDYGDFNLNQGVYTMMSYNDGNPAGVLGQQNPSDMPGFGWEGSPMALDIAALQHLYGVNTTYHTGDDVYTLPALNQAGTFYSCIWDAGGTDAIVAGGAVDCVINLNAATLKLGNGGGGYISAHNGIFGGLTIAHGAVIENAGGGAGDDRLVGNRFANDLDGGDGADLLNGGKGADQLLGGDGTDTFVFINQRDSRDATVDTISDFVQGDDTIDLSRIDADGKLGVLNAFHFIDGTAFSDTAGELRFEAGAGNTTVVLADIDGDGTADFSIILQGTFTLQVTDFDL
jgi:serralysin